MTEVSSQVLLNFSIFLSLTFLFALIAKKIRVSPVVGYIISGLFLGNILQGIYSKEIINNFAYFGIILLLFTVGLEINFTRLLTLKKFIILGGTLQIVLSIVFITILSLLFNFSILVSFLIGIALSSSSTTLVAKIIQDKGEEGSFLGELAIGLLMFQDIAFIPFFIIFTSITDKTKSFFNILPNFLSSLIESSVIIVILFYLGQKIIPVIFNWIAKMSRELLNLFIVVFIFLVLYLSAILKIPIFIGIFIAGILVGQTLEHYHIFSQIRSMRDILAMVFFVFIGFNLKFSLIAALIPKLIFFVSSVVFIKAAVILIIFLILRFHSRTAFLLSLYLFQIDEDAFILMSLAFSNKVITSTEYSFINANLVLTLLMTPILIKNSNQLYMTVRSFTKKFLPFLENFIRYRIDRDNSPIDVINLKDHVVICGYGRVGRYIGRALMLANIPFIAVDYNFHVVESAKKEGVNIIYGDPTDIEILDYVQVDEARMIVSVVPGKFAQETIALNAKKLNPKIIIFNRIQQEGEQQRMKALGVDVVIQPEFEASISIIRKILLWRGLDKEEIARKIKRLKIEHGMI